MATVTNKNQACYISWSVASEDDLDDFVDPLDFLGLPTLEITAHTNARALIVRNQRLYVFSTPFPCY